MRKNISTFFLTIAILSVISLFGFKFPQATFTNFYYYQDKPFHLNLIPDAVFIEFNENANESSLSNLLSEFPNLYLKPEFSLKYKKDFVYVNETLSTEALRNLINSLNEKSYVINASPAFQVPDGFGNPEVMIGVENEVIAQFRVSVNETQINAYLSQRGMSIIQEFDLTGGRAYLISIPQGEYSIDYANELYMSGLVNYSEPNLFFTNLIQEVVPVQEGVVPNDPLFPQQWSHKNVGNNIPQGITGIPGCDMRTDSAWLYTMGSPDVIVSIVDTGIDTLHEDLSDRIINGLSINTYSNLPYAWDDQNHGTAVSGIVAATGNNNLGVIGVAPESKLFGVKIFNSAGSTNSTAIINGMIAAWQRGSWISSNSWGGGSPISAADNAITDGVNLGRDGKGVIWSFATGNSNASSISWPSTHPNVISVGGLSPCNQRKSTSSCDNETWWGAQYGTGLEIVSPATKIYTTDRTGSVGYTTGNYVPNFNGTSSATPNVSGVCALILAVNPDLTWQEVRERIALTADKVGSYTYNQAGQLNLGGWNNEMGYGKINAYQAVKMTIELMGPAIDHTPLGTTEDMVGPYVVSAEITSTISLSPDDIKLVWGRGAGVLNDTLTMVHTTGNTFTANIPGNGLPSIYNYFIFAEDSADRSSTLPVNAPGNYFSFEAATDLTPPSITHTQISDVAYLKWPVKISSEVTDNLGISSVQGEVRINGGSVTTFNMNMLSGMTYEGTFPSLSVNIGDFVEYRIKATDNSNQNNIAYHPETGYHSFFIVDTKGLVLVLDDDLTLSGRTSQDKGGTPDLITPLGASATIFANTLDAAGYVVDQAGFNAADTSVFSDYHLIVISAGVKESSILTNATVRAAVTNFTLAGGKTLTEGGEVGYVFRKTTTTDPDPNFRREVLNDSAWVSDRTGANLNVTDAPHPLFNNPNIVSSPITIVNGGTNGYGARDEVTLSPKTGVVRLANWSGGVASNGGIILYHANNDSTVRNIFFTFSVSQISPASVAEGLIENTVELLMKGVTVPVELTSFSASVNEGKVILNWVTATEINNYGFEIERKSSNGEYTNAGFVSGSGTTTERKSYSFVDQNIAAGLYTYRLKQMDFDGKYAYSDEINVEVDPPVSFALEQNYPNPFNPATLIKYSIPYDGFVNLSIYNVLGEKVFTLINENQQTGRYEVTFDAGKLSSGVYFYSLRSKSPESGREFNSIKKMLLLK